MVDSHSHPYMAETPGAATEIVRRAIQAGVTRIIMPNCDVSTIAPMRELAAAFPTVLDMAMGLHPTEVKPDDGEALNSIITELNSHSDQYVAIGEIGMDLYWDKTYADLMMQTFDRQLAEAERLDMPVIIHCREALDPTLEVLSAHRGVKAVFHSFGGTTADVERISSTGDYYFGINGIVTFRNSNLSDTLPAIPADRLLIETDSPYLAPVPKRGCPNESSYLPYIASHIARCLNVPLDDLIATTTANAARLFPRKH